MPVVCRTIVVHLDGLVGRVIDSPTDKTEDDNGEVVRHFKQLNFQVTEQLKISLPKKDYYFCYL